MLVLKDAIPGYHWFFLGGGGRVPARHVPISYSVFKILAMSIPFSNNLRKFRSKVAIIRFLFIHVFINFILCYS